MKKIIVTGNSNKSVFSYFLATEMAKKQRVLLVCTDEEKDLYSCFFPQNKKETGKSLAKLLADPVVTNKDFFDNSHLITENLLLLSNEISNNVYPDTTVVNCTKLLMCISNLIDVIIIDNTKGSFFGKFIQNDPQTRRIMITTADIRGYNYREKNKFNDINVLSQSSPYSSFQDTVNTFEKKPYQLPYVKQFSAIYNGENINKISPSSAYKKVIKSIISDIETE